jgi:hypothetical protein
VETRLSTDFVKANELVYNVKDFGALGDDIFDSRLAINQAIVTCATSGGGDVYLPPGKYVVSGSLTPRSNVRIIGYGASIRSTTKSNIFYIRDTAVKDFEIEGVTFLGPVTISPAVPTRVTTGGNDDIFTVSGATSGPGAVTALYVSGDTDPDNPGGARVENISIRNCKFRNLAGLPLLLKGVRGVLRVVNNEFSYSMDVGFVAYEELIFSGNHVYGSRDNGLSASRGGKKITVTGNTFENCTFNGIFVAGFLTDKGPQNFTISGNVVKNVGNSGIYLDSAPKFGSITSNELDGGFFRGPVDIPTDGAVCGIFIGGYPLSDRANPTDWAEGIAVVGNHIRQFPRAGIYGTALKRVMIVGNQISSIGTQFMANGTTAISAADQTQNVGILIDNATTSSQVLVGMNHISDARSTPYCNWAITPVGSSAVDESFNTMYNCRNAYNLIETGQTRNINWGAIFQQNSKFTAGATAGSTAGSGTIAGFDINGAAGSTRRHKIQTAGSDRWQYGGSGDAESGSNAGTNFRINAYDDSGIFIKTMFELTRNGKLGFNGVGAVTPSVLPSAATDAASTQTLVNALRSALIALGLAT